MVNRLTTYFRATKLVKDRLVTAQERAKRVKSSDAREALEATNAAVRELMVAFNSVAHIGFGAKAKTRGPKKKKAALKKHFKDIPPLDLTACVCGDNKTDHDQYGVCKAEHGSEPGQCHCGQFRPQSAVTI